jgi:FkbM family methyltransferase
MRVPRAVRSEQDASEPGMTIRSGQENAAPRAHDTPLRLFAEPALARIASLEDEVRALAARAATAERERDGLRARLASGRELASALAARVRARFLGRRSGRDSTPSAPAPSARLELPTRDALHRAWSRGVEVASIVDVGASDGSWSAMALSVWPRANALLLEANEAHRPALEAACARNPAMRHAIAAVGPARRQLWFERTADPYGGRIHSERGSPDWIALPGTTIDDEIRERALAGPHLVKLDTHGYEVPILEGAAETLAQASLVVVECYAFELADGALPLHAMLAWMWERGFMAVDLCEPMWRARDGCLWQVDVVFTPRSRPECGVRSWE